MSESQAQVIDEFASEEEGALIAACVAALGHGVLGQAPELLGLSLLIIALEAAMFDCVLCYPKFQWKVAARI